MLRDDPQAGRFEMGEPGQVVFANYRRLGDSLYIDHVETPPSLRRRGAAGALMAAIVGRARNEGLIVIPVCAYAAAWMARQGHRR